MILNNEYLPILAGLVISGAMSPWALWGACHHTFLHSLSGQAVARLVSSGLGSRGSHGREGGWWVRETWRRQGPVLVFTEQAVFTSIKN